MTDLQPVEPGEEIDRYTVEGVLGRGGMAVVYRVRHRQLGTLHALKLLQVPSEGVRSRLLREGRVQAQLRHPHIVTVTDVVEVRGAPGLVMELIRGPSLDRLLADQRLDLAQVDALAQGIIRGVAAAHAHGLIHRDLKPANILLAVTEGGLVPKITDFGLAKVLDTDGGASSAIETRSGMAMGTPAYMAPEQIRSAKKVDLRADIFALGCVLYELATGRRVFDGEDLLEIFTAITGGRYVPPQDLAPDLPDRMSNAIRAALEVDRDRRPSTCEALLAMWMGAGADSVARGPFDIAHLAERYQVEDGPLAADPERAQARGLRSTFSGSALDGPISTMDHALDDGVLAALSATGAHRDVERVDQSEEPSRAPAAQVGGTSWRAGGIAVAVVGVLGTAGAAVLVGAVAVSIALLPSLQVERAVAPVELADEAVGAVEPDVPEEVLDAPGEGPVAEPPATAPIKPAPVESTAAAPPPRPGRVEEAGERVAEQAPVSAAPVSVAPPPMVPVSVVGDAVAVELVPTAGAPIALPGRALPGAYGIRVTFEGLDPQLVGEAVLQQGEAKTITCHRSLRICR